MVLIALAFATAMQPAHGADAPAPVTVLTIEGAIGPASADYVARGIARAARDGHQLVVLKMDTPGGLDTSMRVIVKAILTSPLPVATYVAPGGARAASAGTYILYASHIAAMAPGTNLGAATPVQIGASGSKDGDKDKTAEPAPMTRKAVNDAAAYIRGMAQLRGRNMEWAERAVREAVSLSATEALKQHVIEYIAADLPALLAQLDGHKFTVLEHQTILQTAGASIVDYQPDWRVRLLAAITDPAIALLLMTVGVYGLIFELMNPGTALPGVLGGICLLLALYALQLLPVNYAGLALVLLGLAFMVAEAFLPSYGSLGVGGIAAFVAGALILIDTEQPGFGIPLAFIVTVALTSAVLIGGMTGIALKTRRRAVAGGPDDLIGDIGRLVSGDAREGWVLVRGETWRAQSDLPLRKGQRVRVLTRTGLLLRVEPLAGDEQGE